MPKFAEDNPYKFSRRLNGEWYTGIEFFETKEQNKSIAKHLRSLGYKARAITLPETYSMNCTMDVPERYLLFVADACDRKSIWGAIINFSSPSEEA